jgi:type IV pilus assembly protein PilM
VRSILRKVQWIPKPGGRPPVVVELASQGVLAAALPGPGKPPVYAFAPLPPGALVPGMNEPNLQVPEAVIAGVRTALGQVAPRTRAVTLLLPDALVRVFVLDFDALPGNTAEAVSVLRFRLRKMIPFDVEQAGVSYQMLAEKKDGCKVVVAVIPGSVLAEYEAVVRQAGYEPGGVLSTSLAGLAAIKSSEPALAANLGELTLTTAITKGDDLLLYRILDLPEDPAQRLQEVQRDIAVATAYYEDKLGAPPQQLYFAGLSAGHDSAAEAFVRWIQQSNLPQLTVTEVAPRPKTGAVTPLGNLSLAGVVGALAGVA